jgi:CRP/FNR family transcriptional regulator, cyclic AMP receptor protein
MFSRKKAEKARAAARLKNVAFFEGFTEDELARVAELADEVEAESGAELTDQGRPGQDCYVILNGRACVFVGDDLVATLEPGSMVGEMALIDHQPRSATVVADTPMELLAFNTKSFKALLDELPKASHRVMSLLNTRLQENAERREKRSGG